MRAFSIVVIAILLATTLLLGLAVVRLESYRYANFLGHCEKFDLGNAQQRLARETCLNTVVTPRRWYLHLFHGVRRLL
jgi:hypothetical protein